MYRYWEKFFCNFKPKEVEIWPFCDVSILRYFENPSNSFLAIFFHQVNLVIGTKIWNIENLNALGQIHVPSGWGPQKRAKDLLQTSRKKNKIVLQFFVRYSVIHAARFIRIFTTTYKKFKLAGRNEIRDCLNGWYFLLLKADPDHFRRISIFSAVTGSDPLLSYPLLDPTIFVTTGKLLVLPSFSFNVLYRDVIFLFTPRPCAIRKS